MVEGEKTEEKTEEPTDEPKEETKEPIEYKEFTMPEGIEIEPESMGKFQEWASRNNLSQEAAQEAIDIQTALMRKAVTYMAAQRESMIEGWKEDTLKLDDFKGDAGLKNIEASAKALKNIAGDGFMELLDQSGLGNHPEMVKLGLAVHNLTKEDSYVPGGAPTSKPQTLEEALYGTKGV